MLYALISSLWTTSLERFSYFLLYTETKLESKLKCKLESKLECKLESKLECKLESKQARKTGCTTSDLG